MHQDHLLQLLVILAPCLLACNKYIDNYYFSTTYMLCEELCQSRRDEQRIHLKQCMKHWVNIPH